ncbi:MAG: hypothetical protein JNK57_07215 [Planctomycetaceae bacterium]|nr:hypothetical protein [Planctomycetaceae bacterium]
MLNRVRDFRYEDIKNWKPLVSLRESYRKESAVRNMILLATCVFAVLVGYSVINGTLKITNASSGSEAEDDTAASLQQPKSVEESGVSPFANTANLLTDEKSVRPLPVLPNRDSRPASYVESSKQESSSTQNPSSSRTIVSGSRIAVCDVQLILAAELAALSNKLVQDAESQLFAEQETVRQSVPHLTELEVVILQKLFEQKKGLATNEIRERMRQYRELADRDMQVIADQVADEYGFDLVVTTDHVLSFTQATDITRVVKQIWDQRRQSQAQVERSVPSRSR